MSIEFKMTDNSETAMSEFKKAIELAMTAIGMTAEGHAKMRLTETVYSTRNKWKLTGRLRNSITHAEDFPNRDIYVGTNVEYAYGIEEGTHRRAGAVHFLKDASTEHSEEYKGIVKQFLESSN